MFLLLKKKTHGTKKIKHKELPPSERERERADFIRTETIILTETETNITSSLVISDKNVHRL